MQTSHRAGGGTLRRPANKKTTQKKETCPLQLVSHAKHSAIYVTFKIKRLGKGGKGQQDYIPRWSAEVVSDSLLQLRLNNPTCCSDVETRAFCACIIVHKHTHIHTAKPTSLSHETCFSESYLHLLITFWKPLSRLDNNRENLLKQNLYMH